MALLEVDSIEKSFAGTPVLRDISFQVEEGEIVCLLGPSGCGKTTALRIVAGLETPDAGEVRFEGRSLAGVPVHGRGFGLMFQDFALFPHKDVAANVAFGLRMQGLPQAQIQARVAEMLALVGLTGYDRRKVYELSGGEQQRVALARSLAPGPRLLMLDEPLGSLDRTLREELMNELRAILAERRVGVTALYVTHDQQEAFAVADRVLIMDRGRIVQEGTPQGVYTRPATAWVARFMGLTNLVAGRISEEANQRGSESARKRIGESASTDRRRDGDREMGKRVVVETARGEVIAEVAGGKVPAPGGAVTVLIRPEAAQPVRSGEWREGEEVGVEGLVRERSFRGGHTRLVLGDFGFWILRRPDDGTPSKGDFEFATPPAPGVVSEGREETGGELAFEVMTAGGRLPEVGERVRLGLRPEALSLLPAVEESQDPELVAGAEIGKRKEART